MGSVTQDGRYIAQGRQHVLSKLLKDTIAGLCTIGSFATYIHGMQYPCQS